MRIVQFVRSLATASFGSGGRPILPAVLIMAVALCLSQLGQSYAQLSLLNRLDPDGDGKVVRDKLPTNYRKMLDRIVDRYGLDKKKGEWKIDELRNAISGGAQKQLAAEQANQGTSGSAVAPWPSVWPGSSRRQANQGTSGSAVAGSTGQLTSIPPHKPGELHPLVRLPEQYASYDKDNDGQIGLYEWPRRRLAEFLKLDQNDDGFLTIKELGKPSEEKEEQASSESKSEPERKESAAEPTSQSTPEPKAKAPSRAS